MAGKFPALVADDVGFILSRNTGKARQNVDIVYEMIGGNDRLADWADKNPSEFYTKLYAKNIERQSEHNLNVSESLEERLLRLEAGDRALNVTPLAVPDTHPVHAAFDDVPDSDES